MNSTGAALRWILLVALTASCAAEKNIFSHLFEETEQASVVATDITVERMSATKPMHDEINVQLDEEETSTISGSRTFTDTDGSRIVGGTDAKIGDYPYYGKILNHRALCISNTHSKSTQSFSPTSPYSSIF